MWLEASRFTPAAGADHRTEAIVDAGEAASAVGGENRRSGRWRVGRRRDADRQAGGVGVDLHPERRRGGAAADGDLAAGVAAGAEGVEDRARTEADALDHRAKDMVRLVGKGQPDESRGRSPAARGATGAEGAGTGSSTAAASVAGAGRRRAVDLALADGDRLVDRQPSALGREDTHQPTVRQRRNLGDGLVGLDLEDGVAARIGLARGDKPAHDHALLHSLAELRHQQGVDPARPHRRSARFEVRLPDRSGPVQPVLGVRDRHRADQTAATRTGAAACAARRFGA